MPINRSKEQDICCTVQLSDKGILEVARVDVTPKAEHICWDTIKSTCLCLHVAHLNVVVGLFLSYIDYLSRHLVRSGVQIGLSTILFNCHQRDYLHVRLRVVSIKKLLYMQIYLLIIINQ